MQTGTYDAVMTLLKADRTLQPRERARLIAAMSDKPENGAAVPYVPEKLIRRQEAAARFGVSKRTVDLWAKQGLLTKRKLPGRKRAAGFVEAEINALITGKVVQ